MLDDKLDRLCFEMKYYFKRFIKLPNTFLCAFKILNLF